MDLQLCYNIISLNSGGLRTKQRFDTALQFCKNSAADFSILQETHLGPPKYNDIKNQWQGEVYISPGTTFRDGILLLVDIFAPKIKILKTDTNGKFIIFKILNTSDVVVPLYRPSGIIKEKQDLRQNFFRKLRKEIRANTIKNENVLLGDFNSTLNALDRSTNEIGKGAKSELENLIQQFDLEDHRRIQIPNEKLYTHYHGRTDTYARIDRAYTDTRLRPNMTMKHVVNSFSDHYHAGFLEKKNQNLKIGKGYWILNNALLDDVKYKNAIIQLWHNWKSQKHCFQSVSQ